MTTIGGIVAVIGALMGAGGLAAVLQARSANRRTDAEAGKISVEGENLLAASITTNYRALIDSMTGRIERLETERDLCLERIAVLEGRLTDVEIGGKFSEQAVIRLIDQEIIRRRFE